MLQLLLVEYHAKIGTPKLHIVTLVLQTIIPTLALMAMRVETQTESRGKLRQYLLCGLISMYILLITHIYSLITVPGATQPIPVHDGIIVMFNIAMGSAMVLIQKLVDVIQSVNVTTGD